MTTHLQKLGLSIEVVRPLFGLNRFAVIAPMLTGKTTFAAQRGPDVAIDSDQLYDHAALIASTGVTPGPDLTPEQWRVWETARVAAASASPLLLRAGLLMVHNPSFARALKREPIGVVLLDRASFSKRERDLPEKSRLARTNREQAYGYAKAERLPIYGTLESALLAARLFSRLAIAQLTRSE